MVTKESAMHDSVVSATTKNQSVWAISYDFTEPLESKERGLVTSEEDGNTYTHLISMRARL